MAELSDVLLIFLFFLAFNGGGLFGNRGRCE